VTVRFMLDTDTVSFALRGQGNVAEEILKRNPSELCVSAITVAELRYGASRRKSAKLHRLIDSFLATVAIKAFDRECAEEFGKLASLLADRGEPIGEADTYIAAHAIAIKVTLVTNNVKHFTRVAGLKVENWA
jgi:tRNA(fMet)-specific endonuclease VapC